MNETPTFSYAKEADVLYIAFVPGEKATASSELNENIVFRFNRAEKRAVGLTLMDFSVLVQRTKLGPRNFPLNGLQELQPEWQDKVIEMITQPPVNQVLKVSAYAPSVVALLPITSIEKSSIPLRPHRTPKRTLDKSERLCCSEPSSPPRSLTSNLTAVRRRGRLFAGHYPLATIHWPLPSAFFLPSSPKGTFARRAPTPLATSGRG